MDREFAIAIFSICLGFGLSWWLFITLWKDSDHRQLEDSASAVNEFKGYMKKLKTEKSGREVLQQFENIEQLKDANRRLKKVCHAD